MTLIQQKCNRLLRHDAERATYTVLVCGCIMCALGANIYNEKRTKQSAIPVYSERPSCFCATPF